MENFEKKLRKTIEKRSKNVTYSPELTKKIMDEIRNESRFFVRLRFVAAALFIAVCIGTLFWFKSFQQGDPATSARQWLAATQLDSGLWAPEPGAQLTYAPALSALAAVALDAESERYNESIRHAVSGLMNLQQPNGSFVLNDDRAGVYNNVVITQSLLALFATGRYPQLNESCKNAVKFIVSRQSSDGAWQYEADPAQNPALTAWNLRSLELAKFSKTLDDDLALRRAERWLANFSKNSDKFRYDSNSGIANVNQSFDITASKLLNSTPNNAGALLAIETNTLPNGYHHYFLSMKTKESKSSLEKRQESAETRQLADGSYESMDGRCASLGGRLMSTIFNLL